MNRLAQIAVGAALGAGAFYAYVTYLRGVATSQMASISNPLNSSDPNVQNYSATWNQLNAIGGVSPTDPTLPPLSTLQANYNTAQQHSVQPGS